MPPLRLLNVFECCIRCQGTKGAAAELNVSQPAISQSLKQLEEYVGASLLDRTTRPASLTPSGEILYEAVRKGWDLLEDALLEINERNQRSQDTVAVYCTIGAATNWLMPILEELFASFPLLSVNIFTVLGNAPPITRETDIVIRYGEGGWQDGDVYKLFSEQTQPVCSPEFAAKIEDPTEFPGSHHLIHVDYFEDHWTTWNHYCSKSGFAKPDRKLGMHFSNYILATQAAIAGRGIMLGWRSITGLHQNSGSLVPAFGEPVAPESNYYAVVAPHATSNAAVMQVVDFIEKAGQKFESEVV